MGSNCLDGTCSIIWSSIYLEENPANILWRFDLAIGLLMIWLLNNPTAFVNNKQILWRFDLVIGLLMIRLLNDPTVFVNNKKILWRFGHKILEYTRHLTDSFIFALNYALKYTVVASATYIEMKGFK